ncbi:MAG: hypothetical protein ABSA05_06560 [Opitutaceae bacterium]|jgi:hypothetical protein
MGYNPTFDHCLELADRLQLSALATATVRGTATGSVSASATAVASTARVDVGGAAVTAIPAASTAIEPATFIKPRAITVDNPSAAHRADTAGPGELQAGE